MRRAEAGDRDAAERGLALHEQAVARGLLDRVLEGRLAASARVPPALARERARVRELWRARLAELQAAMRTRPDAPETKALVDETSALALRARDVEARIDAADARQGTFLSPNLPDLAAIQAELDDSTLLLRYALGDARSYLWVVSSRAMHAFTLPPRAEIETLARRVYAGFARAPAAGSSQQRAEEADRRALTRLVIAPAASLLGRKRLVTVLPGALSIIPFGALPRPGAASGSPPMIDGTRSSRFRAATIVRRDAPADVRPRAADADGGDLRRPDLRHRGSWSAHEICVVLVRRDAVVDRERPAGAAALTRLPFSRGEAEAIRSLAPERVTTFLGPDATRERALARSLFDYRFIHFATHGIVNQDVSSLSTWSSRSSITPARAGTGS